MMNRHGQILFCLVLVLFVMGLSMVFNTTSAEILNRSLDKSLYQALLKQILYAALGGVGALGVWFLGYENILKLSSFFLGAGVVCLILVFVPGIGQQINGAHRWINIGGCSFQPSEFIKYFIPIYYIQQSSVLPKPLEYKSFLKLLAKIAVPMGLILIEPDNGSVAIIMVSLVILFILTRVRLIYWALPLAILTISGVAVASQMPHVGDRIRIYLHPEDDLQGKGHQPYQAKIAAGSGQLFGKGLAQSLQKLDYLPEARSDYIAAIFAEEFGFMGVLVLLFVYMLIGYLGFLISSKTTDINVFYMVSILTFLIVFQAFLNLGVVSGLLPSKGTNLPFFSQGGSSLLANFMVVCVILNVSNRTPKPYV